MGRLPRPVADGLLYHALNRGNNRAAVMGVKALPLKQMGQNLKQQWTEEREYTTKVVRGARAEEAFPEFIARKGRPLA